MKIIIVGVGSIGKRHMRNCLLIGETAVTVVDKRPEYLEEISKMHPQVKTQPAADQLDLKGYDVVFVCTPPDSHLKFMRQALDAGCHCFMEKPFSLTAEGIEPLLKQAKEKGLRVMTGFNMRYLPLLMEMKKKIDAGEVGKVLSCRVGLSSYMPSWHPQEDYRQGFMAFEKSGGGALFDFVHGLDLGQWLVAPIENLFCFKRTAALEMETDDMAALVGTSVDGTPIQFYFDFVDRIHRKTIDVIGSTGTIIWDFSTQETLRQFSSETGVWSEWKRKADYDTPYVTMIREFFKSINEKKDVPSDGYNGLSTMKLLDAAVKSNHSGKMEKV